MITGALVDSGLTGGSDLKEFYRKNLSVQRGELPAIFASYPVIGKSATVGPPEWKDNSGKRRQFAATDLGFSKTFCLAGLGTHKSHPKGFEARGSPRRAGLQLISWRT